MIGVKISQLPAAAGVSGPEQIPLVKDQQTQRVAIADLPVVFTGTEGVEGETNLNVTDLGNATVYRVKVGPNNSGPDGIGRALYIDNA